MPLSSLSYNSPLEAVFLRILACELYVAKENPMVKNVTAEQVQAARKELGLPPHKLPGGGPHYFIRGLRHQAVPTLSVGHTPPQPLEKGWDSEWRLLNLPPHNLVRQLSDRPILTTNGVPVGQTTHHEFLMTLRDPALPTLHVFTGDQVPPSGTFNTHRGLYFIRTAGKLYLGKTDEFDVRLLHHYTNHQKKNDPVLWWVFVSPQQSVQTFTQDALAAAESLLISFWNEISVIENSNRGGDQKPAFVYLQQGILLVEAASAVLLWLMRKKQDLGFSSWSIPFKKEKYRDWPECYMELPG